VVVLLNDLNFKTITGSDRNFFFGLGKFGWKKNLFKFIHTFQSNNSVISQDLKTNNPKYPKSPPIERKTTGKLPFSSPNLMIYESIQFLATTLPWLTCISVTLMHATPSTDKKAGFPFWSTLLSDSWGTKEDVFGQFKFGALCWVVSVTVGKACTLELLRRCNTLHPHYIKMTLLYCLSISLVVISATSDLKHHTAFSALFMVVAVFENAVLSLTRRYRQRKGLQVVAVVFIGLFVYGMLYLGRTREMEKIALPIFEWVLVTGHVLIDATTSPRLKWVGGPNIYSEESPLKAILLP